MTVIAGYEVHPAADIFPLLDPLELAKLVADIEEHGQHLPIVLHKGQILDGRNRLRACVFARIEPRFVEWDGQGGSAVAYVMSVNLRRRHQTESQLAMIAVQLLPMLEAEASERQRSGKAPTLAPTGAKVPSGKAAEQAAEVVGVGTRTVERAKKVATEAPEIAEEVRAGEVTLREAERKLANKMLGGSAQGKGPESDEANTPEELLGLVRAVAPIGVDPCWNATCGTRPRVGYTIDDNGLEQIWEVEEGELVFTNYPFTQSEQWTDKVLLESERSPIILLSKIDTRVAWWKKLRIHPNYRARVQLDGYWKFGGSPNPAPFSVALWLHAPNDAFVERFARTMRRAGELVYPLRVIEA